MNLILVIMTCQQFYNQFSQFSIVKPIYNIQTSKNSISMSRGNVFKLSGNLALGGNADTYSTSQLQSIKSSLRLLKAKQSQKKSEHNIDIANNYGGSYSSNNAQRSEIKRSDNNKDLNYYQSNAKNHVSTNSYNGNRDFDQLPIKAGSKNSLYQNQKNFPMRQKNTNMSAQGKNQYNASTQARNDYNSSANRNSYAEYGKNQVSLKQVTARNQQKTNTFQQRGSNEQDYNKAFRPQQQQQSRPKAQTRPPLRKQQLNQQADYEQVSHNKNAITQNALQNKTIKEVNQSNKTDIVQYDPSSFTQCSVGCGRKFNPDSISKHEAICYKVFQKKRKQFNTLDQRIIDNQHKKIVKTLVIQEKRNAQQSRKTSKKGAKNEEKMSKWKAQSLAFRAMLKSNQKQGMTQAEKQQYEEIKNVGMVKCPHCGRTFNDTAGPKHISFCQNQNKKNKFKK